MSPDIKESCEFRLLVCRLGFRAPPVRCHVDPIQQDKIGSSLRWVGAKKEETLRGCCHNQAWIRGDRWVRSAQISPTWKDRMDRQPDATRVLRLSHETVRWQASQQRLCSIWQFCLRCNSQSQKPVKSDISLQLAFFHFAKCIHRSSGWVNFNRQLPSILYYLWHSNTLLLLKLVCVKEQNYLLNTGSVDWINGWPRQWARRWTSSSEKVAKYGADSKKKKKPKKPLKKINLQTKTPAEQSYPSSLWHYWNDYALNLVGFFLRLRASPLLRNHSWRETELLYATNEWWIGCQTAACKWAETSWLQMERDQSEWAWQPGVCGSASLQWTVPQASSW